MINYNEYITEVPDFPKKGISFKDISPLLSDVKVYKQVIKDMGNLVCETWLNVPDYWIGIDARGFLFASALSIQFGGGVVMCRKKGKLPKPTANYSYQTEYSNDTLSMHFGSGTAIIVDDVLATGGTLKASNYLAEIAGYDVIDNLVLMDLLYLTKIKTFDLDVKSLIQYE